MKWLILTMHQQAYAPQRLVEEIEKRGDTALNIEYHEVQLTFETGKIEADVAGKPISDFEAFIFRTPILSAYAHFSFYPQRQLLAEYLYRHKNNRVLNQELLRMGFEGMNKLTQTAVLVQNGLPVIPSTNFGYFDQALTKEWTWPVIAKAIVGSHGSGVKKVLHERDMRFYLSAFYPWRTLFQPFLTTATDYRILVLGNKVLGAMKRSAQPGKYLTNVSAGGTFEQVAVTAEMKKLAVKAAKAFKAEYCGVDLMYDDAGKPYVLEVNDGAQFEGFEKCTGINVAESVIDYVAAKK